MADTSIVHDPDMRQRRAVTHIVPATSDLRFKDTHWGSRYFAVTAVAIGRHRQVVIEYQDLRTGQFYVMSDTVMKEWLSSTPPRAEWVED